MDSKSKEEIILRLLIVVLSTLAASLCQLAITALAEKNYDDMYDRREQHPF